MKPVQTTSWVKYFFIRRPFSQALLIWIGKEFEFFSCIHKHHNLLTLVGWIRSLEALPSADRNGRATALDNSLNQLEKIYFENTVWNQRANILNLFPCHIYFVECFTTIEISFKVRPPHSEKMNEYWGRKWKRKFSSLKWYSMVLCLWNKLIHRRGN